MSNAMMLALKNVITQGTKFALQQDGVEHSVVLNVTGGLSIASLKLPFGWVTPDEASAPVNFKWESSSYTAGLLVSAVEGMPDDADPQFILNTSLWNGGGLVLSGHWETKKGRAKEGTPHYRTFLVDAGVIE